MARRGRRRSGGSGGGGKPDAPGTPLAASLLNLVIADIVLRGAGGLVQRRLAAVPLLGPAREEAVRQLVAERSLLSAVAVAGAARLAARSPLGLALVGAGLVTKLLYDRGKQLEAKGRRPESAPAAPGKV